MASLKEFVVNWADRAESSLKKGCRLDPPVQIFDYLDLLGRGWGWDRLAPCPGSNEWPAYKKYLKEYYRCNSAESISKAWQDEKDEGAAVNDSTDINVLTPRTSLHEQEDCGDGNNGIIDGGILVSLVSLCIEMENEFFSECERQGKADQTADHIMLSKEIQRCALGLKDMQGEFPVAAAALMFIIKMAEVMCEWMRHGSYNPDFEITKVRRYALHLMKYRGPDSDCAAAVLVGISKETTKICECLRQGTEADTWSKTIMDNGWIVLSLLHGECISSGNGSCTAATKAGNTTHKPDCDEDSEDEGNLVTKYSEIGPDSMIDMRELCEEWADSAQAYLNIDVDLVYLPPGGIFEHLDLLGKGWGWRRLVPYIGSDDWCNYKNYLKQYYFYNHNEIGAQACLNEKVASGAIGNIDGNELTFPGLIGNRDVTHWRKKQEARTSGYGAGVGARLALLVRKCINMETKLVSDSKRQGVGDDAYHIIQSREIQKRANCLVKFEGELPVAAAALKCIKISAEMMCEWLRLGSVDIESMVTDVRQYAFDLMMYNDSEYYCAAAVMLGIAKETKRICKCLRQGESITRVQWSKTIMENGWDVLKMLHDEFICVGNRDGTAAPEAGNLPRINTVGEINHKKSDDENAQEGQHGQMSLHDEFLCAGNGTGIAACEAVNLPGINTVGELNHKRTDDENEEDQDGQMRKGLGEPEKSRELKHKKYDDENEQEDQDRQTRKGFREQKQCRRRRELQKAGKGQQENN